MKSLNATGGFETTNDPIPSLSGLAPQNGPGPKVYPLVFF